MSESIIIALITAVGAFVGSLLGNVISPIVKYVIEERKEYKEKVRKKDAETYKKILGKLGRTMPNWRSELYTYRTQDIRLSDELNLNREEYRIIDPKGRQLFNVLRKEIEKVAHFLAIHSSPKSRGEDELRILEEGFEKPSPFPVLEAYKKFRNYMDKYTD